MDLSCNKCPRLIIYLWKMSPHWNIFGPFYPDAPFIYTRRSLIGLCREFYVCLGASRCCLSEPSVTFYGKASRTVHNERQNTDKYALISWVRRGFIDEVLWGPRVWLRGTLHSNGDFIAQQILAWWRTAHEKLGFRER